MDVVFVRHGEGEHMLDIPRSLETLHPRLTGTGRRQVAEVRQVVAVTDRDLLVVSPTPRTIETSMILCGQSAAPKYTSRSVGPRIFPHKDGCISLLCDQTLNDEDIRRLYPDFEIAPNEPTEEINTIPTVRFEAAAANLVRWCKSTGRPRLVVVSHDGSIHSYREFLGEKDLTRASFLGPAGWYKATI